MNAPPPIPRIHTPKHSRTTLIVCLVGGVVLLLMLVGFFAIRSIIASGITKGPDNLFGDQNLKTAVALIELHKVRYGKYPGSMRDLKFTGQWDQMAQQSVAYYVSADRTHYYVEVERGWVGKPSLQMSAEFWQGTGYDPSLKPRSQ